MAPGHRAAGLIWTEIAEHGRTQDPSALRLSLTREKGILVEKLWLSGEQNAPQKLQMPSQKLWKVGSCERTVCAKALMGLRGPAHRKGSASSSGVGVHWGVRCDGEEKSKSH